MVQIELSYTEDSRPVVFPDEWLGAVVQPEPVSPPFGDLAEVARALDSPIGTERLVHMVRPDTRIAIIVDDHTRKTPAARMIPALLEALAAAGARPELIRFVMALGTHRPMTRSELHAKLGPEIVDRYSIVNVPCTSEDEMVFLGDSSDGIPAWVNRTVADADLRIGVGMITPHMDAGFSGGAKIILPGVCSELTVNAFHQVGALFPENQLGRVESPLRRHLEQFVAERVPLHFILNAVITLEGAIYRCVAGHPVAAHRTGIGYALEVFSVPLSRRYPVVVVDCAPYDVDWWQSFKGMFCGDLLTADGGTLIVVTAAPEGNSTYPLVPAYAGRDPSTLTAEIQAGAITDAKQAVAGVQIGRLRRRLRLALVSGGLAAADATTMGMTYYRSVDQAIQAAVTRLPASERVHSVAVIPRGGIVLPVVTQGA